MARRRASRQSVSPLERIQAARAALRVRLGSGAPVPSGEGRPIELMESVQEAVARDLDIEARHGLGARLVALVEAEERLRDGRYGRCETCGEAIPARRLAILPEARQCVACAEAVEARGPAPVKSATPP